MVRLWSAVTVVVAIALATVAAFAVAATADAAPPPSSACGALPRTRVFEIEAVVIRCPDARRLASRHERSVARGGACRLDGRGCTIGRFRCVYVYGTAMPMRILCAATGDQKVLFKYRAKPR